MKTFSQLVQLATDYCIDTSRENFDGVTDTNRFIKREINNTIRHIFSLIRQYKLEPPAYTFTTVANTEGYNLPVSTLGVDTVTVLVNNIKYDLKPVFSQSEYNKLTSYPNPTSIPQRFFVDGNTLKLFPKPQGAYTTTVTYNFLPKPMTADDSEEGTATISTVAGVSTVTLSDAVVTDEWEGRFFALTDGTDPSGYFYKISSVESTTEFVLDQEFLEGDVSNHDYVVGESVEMPWDLFEWVPYRVAGIYYQTRQKDPESAASYFNLYFTGDPLNNKRSGKLNGGILMTLNHLRELGHGNSPVVETSGGERMGVLDGIWSINVPI